MSKKRKILFLDLDGTLIESHTGKSFTGYTSWKLKEHVAEKVRELKRQGYLIVLVTNQANIARGMIKLDKFLVKLDNVQVELKVIFDEVYIAESKDSALRKPKVNYLVDNLRAKGIDIDQSLSLMIGDGGGRKSDFSDSDKLFADNLGIEFLHVDDI